MGKGLRQAAAGRQATLTIGPNQNALLPDRRPRAARRAGSWRAWRLQLRLGGRCPCSPAPPLPGSTSGR
jgi:hypothetical protein